MRVVNRKLPLFLAVMGCLYGSSAFAQTAPEQQKSEQGTGNAKKDDKAEAKKNELGTITVTGSLIKRKEFDSISPVQVITADTSVMAGQTTTAEFLQKSSVAAGSTQITNQFSGFVVEGGTGVQTISLRGLGANRSLVLLNGNRPGPAGTRGQVAAFDLNVIPQIILQRAEILKDGSSSIYGSDAVAGVVNLITRKNISKPEVSVTASTPVHGGGESYEVSAVTGWNFTRGNIAIAASGYQQEALETGDRPYLNCNRDRFWARNGQRLDLEDHSILRGTKLAGCNDMFMNAVVDLVYGDYYVPSPDGVTIGGIPGYRPSNDTDYSTDAHPYYEEVQSADFLKKAQIINRQKRTSVYGSADVSLGSGVNLTAELLYTHRETEARGFRQFFPYIGGKTALVGGNKYKYANSPNFAAPVPGGIAEPVLSFRSAQNIKVNYLYSNVGLDGQLPFRDWTWKVDTSYSRSKGTYDVLGINNAVAGDVRYSATAPTLNYFDPGFLSGARLDELVKAIGIWYRGTTTYDQFIANGAVTGTLFTLPAGDVNGAFGAEYRRYSINDQPSSLLSTGQIWGSSTAQVTKGSDKVKEVFGEIEVPLLKGLPGVQALTANASARVFKYDSVNDGWSNVWKLGLSWQITPTFRLRATKGTSFRAPGLYELYLGDQSGFQSQTAIDPCIRWERSTNSNIRTNCAAAGIPVNYRGGTSSAQVFTGGGAGRLKPETSKAFNAGIVFTPTFAPISVALDYFDMQVNGEIASLGAADILYGCYGAQVYPNDFCSMFVRKPSNDPTAPNSIDTVHAQYININKERTRGYDMIARYDGKFGFGKVEVESQITKVLEDVQQLFSSASASGFKSSNYTGLIGQPSWVGNLRVGLKRNDWAYNWQMDYVGRTRNFNIHEVTTYAQYPEAFRETIAASRIYHTASVRYEHGKWSLLLGVRNIFDSKPPQLSAGVATLYGNTPAFATQYDILGRTLFGRFNYKF